MDNLSDDIIKYKKGELTSKQMHALEKKALADPFLAEALEGAGNIPPEELVADISAINEKIANKKKSILFTPLRIAAGIVLLIGSVFLVYQFIPKAETIALKTEKPKPENKNADEKQNAGSGAVIKNEKESEKLKAKSEEAEIKTSKPLISSNQNQAARIKQPESSNQNPTTKIQEPLQAPVQDLASAEEAQTKIEITHDQKPKEIVEPNKAAGAKSMALDKKKEAIVKSDVARSAMPTAKMQIPKSISGHVVSSEDGSPLPGVNVILKGTSNGSVTDARGNYTISVDANNESLVFSFVGFQQQEVEASGRDKVDVQMKDDAAQLSEVVVTGVGIVKDEN